VRSHDIVVKLIEIWHDLIVARKSRLVEALTIAEDILLFFDDYFKSTSWVQSNCGLPQKSLNRSSLYLVEKNILDKNLDIKQKPRTIYKEIVKSWDGSWRIVIYDVPEKNRILRNKLHRVLNELGFKNLQRSVLLSPFASSWIVKKVEKLVEDPEKIFTFKTKISKKKSNYLVDSLWLLDDWELAARRLIKKLKDKDKVSIQDQREFWNLVSKHPKVPLDLLPRTWPLKKLAKVFVRYSS